MPTEHAGYAAVAALDKPLPSNEEAERCVLGSVLLDNDRLNQVVDVLSPEDFYSPFHKSGYRAMLGLHECRASIEPAFILEEMTRSGDVLSHFGPGEIANLGIGLPIVSDLGEYIDLIREKSERRRLLRLNNQAQSIILSDDVPIAEAYDILTTAKPTDLQKNHGALIIKTANQFLEDAKAQPIPRQIFGNLIFEGELTLFFGSAKTNKSTLGVQAGEGAASGRTLLELPCEVDGCKTLFCDFELSQKQWEGRYSNNYREHYSFSDNFLRAEFNRNMALPEKLNFEKYVFASIEAAVKREGIKLLIVDNKTALKAATEKSHDAGPLMNELNRLKHKYGLTIILICHTPKRDESQPLTINDLAGSKVLSNLADATFAIGLSHSDPSIRYVKQFLSRSSEVTYDGDNVILYRVTKPGNFLGLEFLGYGCERDHLAQSDTSDAGGRRLREAVEFLQTVLKDGPVDATEVKQAAEGRGIASATLRRAREKLNVDIKWGMWSL